MHWWLILEEYGPEHIYIPGLQNVVADALSCLELIQTSHKEPLGLFADQFNFSEQTLDPDVFPVSFPTLEHFQRSDANLSAQVQQSPTYYIKTFHGGDQSHDLVCHNDKIVVPTALQDQVVHWYHNSLCHPGETRTEQTIRQHFWWPKLKQMVHASCVKCQTCQKTKRSTKKYGHLPPKEAETQPWDKLCVDLIGPYTIKRKGKKNLTLWCVTMIDPATGWFEMREIKTKSADVIANEVEMAWLTRYP